MSIFFFAKSRCLIYLKEVGFFLVIIPLDFSVYVLNQVLTHAGWSFPNFVFLHGTYHLAYFIALFSVFVS